MAEWGDAPDVENIKSAYNEASFKMIRFHEEQSKINNVRDKPLSLFIDETTGNEIRGYNVWFSSLVNMMSELWSKLNDEEKEESRRLKNIIEFLFLINPPYKVSRDDRSGYPSNIFSMSNWLKLKDKLYDFELKLREFKEKHGYDSPEEDESALF